MRHGIFCLASAYAAGTLLARAFQFPAWPCLAVLLASVAAAVFFLARGRLAVASAALLAGVAAVAAYASALALSTPADSITRVLAAGGPAGDGAVLAFRGTVLGVVSEDRREGRPLFRYRMNLGAVRLAGRFCPSSGAAFLYASDEIPYGSAVEGTAFWRLPASAANPGEFDYRAFLANSGVVSIARAGEGTITVVGRSAVRVAGRFSAAARRELLARLDALGLGAQGIIPAVLLGDRSDLPDESRDAFVRSGTMHLLAISGMNLTIVAGLFWWLLRVLGASQKASSLFSLAVAVAYIMIVGASPPVVRAGLMLGIFCLGVVTDRDTRALSVVSAAALIMLVAQPLQLYDVGFQLSFVSVLGLFYLGVPLGRGLAARLKRSRLPLRSAAAQLAYGIAVSVGTGAAVVPLTAYYFKIASFIFPLANLVLIPATTAMTVAGFVAVGLSFVSAALASLAALSASGAETTIVALATVFSKVPGAYSYLPAGPAWLVVAAYGFLAALALAAARGRHVAAVMLAGLAACAALVFAAVLPGRSHHPEVFALSGSRGPALLVLDSKCRTVLFLAHDTSEAAAAATICPFLFERGLMKVDLLVETAGSDARLRGGLESRVGMGKVLRQRRFRVPDGPAAPPAEDGAFTSFGPGDVVRGPGGVEIAFHSPRPIDFSNPGGAHFEGLVADVSVGGRRAVVVVDATDGCLAICGGKLVPRPDALCVLSYQGSPAALEGFRARLAPRAFAIAGRDFAGALPSVSISLDEKPAPRRIMP